MKIIAEENINIEDIPFYLKLFKLHKSFLLLISDQPNMGIGSITLGSPPISEGLKSLTTSYNLFGVNKKLMSTIIAERASNILKAPVLLLLFVKSKKNEEEIIKPLVKFLNDTLENLNEKTQ